MDWNPQGGGGGVLPYITYTGMCRPMGLWFWSFLKIFLERGANLESRAAHTHPKNTQVPPPPPGLKPSSLNKVP